MKIGIETIEEFLLYETDFDPDNYCVLPFDEREALAETHGFEPQMKEIYEWWLVAPFFANVLDEQDEPILVTDYGTWWGRTCTGQSLVCDWIIQRLAMEAGTVTR